MKAQKRIPMRTCTICRSELPKREMIRLTKAADGEISIDDTGRKPGRGLYVCKSEDCLANACKGNRLEKIAGAKISEEVMDRLAHKAAELSADALREA